MEATTRQPHADRSWAKLGRTLLDRLDHGIRELERRIDQKLHRAGDRTIRKFLIEYDRNQHKSFLAYYDGVAKLGEAGGAFGVLSNLGDPSHMAAFVLLDGAALAVGIALNRTLMTAKAEKILATRHPKPREAYYDPKKLPNLPRTGYPADGILSARKCLIDIDRNVELFRVAQQVPVVKDFESRFGKESPEERAHYAYLVMHEHYRFRSVIDNLRKPMMEAIDTIQKAMEYLRVMPDSEARRNVLKELQDRVDQLMPFGDMVNHHHGSKDFSRKDLLDLSNQLNTLAGPAVAVRPSPNPQPTAADDRMAAPTATNRMRRP
jgi:hypothetical protein